MAVIHSSKTDQATAPEAQLEAKLARGGAQDRAFLEQISRDDNEVAAKLRHRTGRASRPIHAGRATSKFINNQWVKVM